MKDSTKALSKELGWRNAEKAAHCFFYAKYLARYIYHIGKKVGLVEREPPGIVPSDIDEVLEIYANKVIRDSLSPETSTYHGKVVPLSHAEDLVRVEEDIELRDLEKVIPFKIARDIVLVNPSNIVLLDCACRTLQNEPCLPLGVCLAVGDPFASFLLEHGVMNARRITSEEAVGVLRAEHSRGHVHTAYFKDVTGGRFYAICNCCSCCCVGMRAYTRLGTPMLAASGYVAAVSGDCNACGECAAACPFDAVSVGETAVVDVERCMGCGVCEGVCESGAVGLKLDPSKGEPLDIKKLISESMNGNESRG